MATISVSHLSKNFRAKIKEPGFVGSLKSFVSPKYKDVRAVNDVSFELQEGELVGFIGPNGAGKSTTIKMLTGILFPSSGSIRVLGRNPQKERQLLAYDIGVIFGQRQQLWYHLPPIDSFNLFSKIYEIKPKDFKRRLKELVQLFEIEPFLHTPVRKLSLGERMRCEFVASLLHSPKVLFLDEPTIGMDIIAKKNVREYIRKLNKTERTTIILTSHDMADIEELCPRVMVINHGKLLFDGSISKVKDELKHKIIEFSFDEKVGELPVIPHTTVLKKSAFRAVIRIDRKEVPVKKVLDAYIRRFKIADILISDPPIEEVIEHLYLK